MTGSEYIRQRLAAYYNTQAQIYQARVTEYKSLLPGQTDKWWQDFRSRSKSNEKAIQDLEDMGIKGLAEARKRKQASLLRERKDIKELADLENQQKKFNAQVANKRASDARSAANRKSSDGSGDVAQNVFEQTADLRKRFIGLATTKDAMGRVKRDPSRVDAKSFVDSYVADASKDFQNLDSEQGSIAAASMLEDATRSIEDLADMDGITPEFIATAKSRLAEKANELSGIVDGSSVAGDVDLPQGPADSITSDTDANTASSGRGYNFVDLEGGDYSAVEAELDELFGAAPADDPAVVRAAELYTTLRDGDVTAEDATEMIRNLSPAERAAFMSRAADALEEKTDLELQAERAEMARNISRRDVEDYTRYENVRSAGGKKFINATKAIGMLDEIYGGDMEAKKRAIRQYADNIGLDQKQLNKVLSRLDRRSERLIGKIDNRMDRSFPESTEPLRGSEDRSSGLATPAEVQAFNQLYSDRATPTMEEHESAGRMNMATDAVQKAEADVDSADMEFLSNLDSNRVTSDVVARKGMSSGLAVAQTMDEYMKSQTAGHKINKKEYGQAVDNAW